MSKKHNNNGGYGSRYYNNWDDDDDYYGHNVNKKKEYKNDRYSGSSYGSGYGSSSGYSGYGGRYGGNYGYGYNYNTWSWGNYGYSYFDEDEKELYVKAHENYLTPKDSDISPKLKYVNDTVKNRSIIKEYARFFYHKMIDEKDFVSERFTDETRMTEQEISESQSKKTFYEEIWDKYIPGYTPLEQALALFTEQISKQKDQKGDLEATPEELTQQLDQIEFHEEIYNDPVINELLEMQPLLKNHKMETLRRLSMIRNLGSKFKIQKEVEEKIVANSSFSKKKVMNDYSQLHMVDIYQRMLPTYKAKVLTKNLVITAPIEKTEHKQKIIILVDYSGSMCSQDKQQWVLTVMLDRLKYAMLEEAEIFFSYFVNSTSQLRFTHVYDRKSAIAFWSKFSTSPNGGDTCLGDMVNYIKDQIENKKRLHNLDVDLSEERPEILAISDGQDTVKTSGFTYKTNAMTLVDAENLELKNLCLKNNGLYVYVDRKNEFKIYENKVANTN